MMLTPGRLLALATVVAIVAIEWSPGGVLVGLAGAVLGVFLGLAGLQLGLLVGALLLGVQVGRVVIGLGPRLFEWGSPARPIVLRAVPLYLSVTVGPGRAPVRLRMWGAALCSAVLGMAAAVLITLAALTAGPFVHGLAIT